MTGYQYGQAWYGWIDEDTPLLRTIVCIPLSMLEPNRYGCNYLPNWNRYFQRSSWGRDLAAVGDFFAEFERRKAAGLLSDRTLALEPGLRAQAKHDAGSFRAGIEQFFDEQLPGWRHGEWKP